MKPLIEIPFVQDILSQPSSLQHMLAKFEQANLRPLATALQSGAFDRIILSGMGASLHAAYPAWLALAQAGLPAVLVDTAELVHHVPRLVTPRTLYWLFSQSGRSAEIVSALDFEKLSRPAALLATVNDLQSPLAKACLDLGGLSALTPIHAVVEQSVSTRTYINSIAAGLLAADTLTGRDLSATHAALGETAMAMQAYLDDWEIHLKEIGEQVGFPKRLVLLGRGSSLAAANTGALVLAEAAKFSAVPYQAGEFRHGPLELALPNLSALIFAGPPETQHLNAQLLAELRGYQVAAFWIGTGRQVGQITIPEVPPIGMPLVEILPIQLLSLHLATAIGVEAGHFLRIGKVTLKE